MMYDKMMMATKNMERYTMGLLDELPKPGAGKDKYRNEAIRWLDEGDHYELIFTDFFVTPSSRPSGGFGDSSLISIGGNSLITDIVLDMKSGNKQKEVHVFVGSFGGEVAALSMVLQQLLTYEHRVGINLGTACSCGWMLLFACQERYVSPFSQAMYHDISVLTFGKHSELRSNAEFMAQWQKELLHVTDTQTVLTPKELELGRTSEVWFTGKELIARGAARDYREYLTRRIPGDVLESSDGRIRVRRRGENRWEEYQRVENVPPLSYEEVLAELNPPADKVQPEKSEKPEKSKKRKE